MVDGNEVNKKKKKENKKKKKKNVKYINSLHAIHLSKGYEFMYIYMHVRKKLFRNFCVKSKKKIIRTNNYFVTNTSTTKWIRILRFQIFRIVSVRIKK